MFCFVLSVKRPVSDRKSDRFTLVDSPEVHFHLLTRTLSQVKEGVLHLCSVRFTSFPATAAAAGVRAFNEAADEVQQNTTTDSASTVCIRVFRLRFTTRSCTAGCINAGVP